MHRIPVPVVVLLAALALACGDAAHDPRPDVVLVMVDTLRPDHLDFRGYERPTAPFLSRLAADSAVFVDASSSSSWTAPATASLLTGLYPARHGVTLGLAFQRKLARRAEQGNPSLRLEGLAPDVTTLAQRLAAFGYRTWAVTANLNLGPELDLARGFERHEHRRGATAEVIGREVEALADELRAGPGPYLLYLHYMDPHKPYHERQPWYRPGGDERADVVAAYDSEIAFFDRELARLHRRMGWDEDTLLVVVSDHGEEFWERGRLGHEFSLHRELTEILMLFHGPGIAPARLETPVSIVDVLPTIAGRLGIPVEPLDGRDLTPLLLGEAPNALERRTLFAHRAERSLDDTRQLYAAVEDRWKLIDGPDGAALYDRANDPEERTDASAGNPEVRARLAERLAEHRATATGGRPVDVELDAELRESLEALGYVGEDPSPAP